MFGPLVPASPLTEAGWWSGEDSSRDYYIAQTPEGSRWWLYREAATARWFLQGIWA